MALRTPAITAKSLESRATESAGAWPKCRSGARNLLVRRFRLARSERHVPIGRDEPRPARNREQEGSVPRRIAGEVERFHCGEDPLVIPPPAAIGHRPRSALVCSVTSAETRDEATLRRCWWCDSARISRRARRARQIS